MRLTFVGTGVSCAIPVIGHLTTNCACRDAIQNPDGPNRRNNVALLISLPFPRPTHAQGCDINATSEEEEGDSVEWHHVLIDCGKTFRNAYLRVLAPMRVRYVDALLLTHGHADAMHCVEELCAMQAEAARDFYLSTSATSSKQATEVSFNTEENALEIPRTLRRIPTYLTYPTLEQIEMVSHDLVRSSFHVAVAPSSHDKFTEAMRETANAISSYAAETSVFNAPATVMDLFFLDEKRPQRIYVPMGPLISTSAEENAHTESSPLPLSHAPSPSPASTTPSAGVKKSSTADLPFYSFPVEHGPKYISMCFAFGHGIAFKSAQRDKALSSNSFSSFYDPQGSCVVYISDVSAIPASSMTFLLDLVKIDVLILDLLAEHGAPSASHYCADEAVPMVVRLAPRKAYFVGMFCSLEHHSTNKQLAGELAELKAQVRAELESAEGRDSSTPEEAAERAQKRRFLEETESMELAYDGQQLEMNS